jgi:O-antigen/teichoic acid export membrane protein
MSLRSPPREASAAAHDTLVALKSAAILGGSLVATWTVALLVRLFLPRHLGPELMGVLSFADGFTTAFFVVLAMGVETYIQKEIPVRPGHASEFFGGVVAVRLLASAGIFAAMAVVMALAHRPAAVQKVVFIYGLSHLFMCYNASLAALLHASREVAGLAVVNIVSKVLWGTGMVLALVLGLGLSGLAIALLASEVLRTGALAALARRHVGLEIRFDLSAVKPVMAASLPFFVSQTANTVYSKVDLTLITLLSNDAEVGWYGTAGNLASLALLVAPLLSWVLLPLLSRAASRSRAELFSIVQRAREAILLVVLPVSLLMGIGADIWIPTLFGEAFAPATLTLRILSPLFVFTYVATLSATCLIRLDRAWTVAVVALCAVATSSTLDLVLIPWGMRSFGPGGAGVGAAIALLVTEAGVMTALTVAVGREAFSRSSALTIGKALLCCGATIAVDLALRPLGAVRVALDMAFYLVLLFGVGAVKVQQISGLARFLLGRSWNHARV